MSKTRTVRPIPLVLTALVAFFSALAALAFSNGMDMAHAHDNAAHDRDTSMAMTMTVHSSPPLSATCTNTAPAKQPARAPGASWKRESVAVNFASRSSTHSA